jgi:hypothetical protein
VHGVTQDSGETTFEPFATRNKTSKGSAKEPANNKAKKLKKRKLIQKNDKSFNDHPNERLPKFEQWQSPPFSVPASE